MLVNAVVTVGVGVTLIVKFLAELTQPLLVPVTVYTVVDVGLNTLEAPEPLGNHV